MVVYHIDKSNIAIPEKVKTKVNQYVCSIFDSEGSLCSHNVLLSCHNGTRIVIINAKLGLRNAY